MKKKVDKKEMWEWFGDVFDNYEPSVPLDQTVSKMELLKQYPQIALRKFERYQQAGAMRRARQGVGGTRRWSLRYRKDIAYDTMNRIAEMDNWSKYQMTSRIVYLEDKVRKMKERGLKEIYID